MKVAITEWHGRVAPVFDVARTVLMVETEMHDKTTERLLALPLGSPAAKVAFLAGQGVHELVCGAISTQVQVLAKAEDLKVHPFVSGEIRAIVDACRHGTLEQVEYSMPGCRHSRHPLRSHRGYIH